MHTHARGSLKAIFTVLFTVLAFPAASTPVVETFNLSNGMEVIALPNHRVPAVSHMLWFRVGAADDPPGKSGLAHYHEHMMFKGTRNYKSGEYADIIARHGGQQNAFTGHDATSYFVNISKEHLPLVMRLEADRLRGLTPSDEDAEKEKQVIIEERRERTENNPQALLDEQMGALLYRHHPYRIPVIGWMHEMEGLTKKDTLDFHNAYYHASNAILIVSGDITAAELKPLVEKYYGNLPKMPTPERRWVSEPPQRAPRHITLEHPNVKQPEWTKIYEASSFNNGNKKEALPLFLLSQLLGGGKTSHLYQTIVVEKKLASAIDTSYNGFSIGPAEFGITAVPEQGVTLEALGKAIDEEIKTILSKDFKAADIARAKTLLKAESVYARDGLSGIARIMGWVRMAGLHADYFSRWDAMIDAVTPQEISEAATHALDAKASVTGWLLPASTQEKKP
ncbi:MAG: M16 family metallopeptidase [Alphaproteobacteria bacterium]